MSEIKEIESTLTQIGNALNQNVLSTDGLIQFGIIILASIIGWFIHRRYQPKMVEFIQKTNLFWRAKTALANITKLTRHIIVFFILSFAVLIHTSGLHAYETKILDIVASLGGAWIFIKIIAQFIVHRFIRNVTAMIAWVLAALSILDILDETVSALDALGFTIGDFRLSILSIIQAVLILALLVTGAGFLSRWADKRLNASKDLTPSFKVLLSKIIKVTLLTVAVLVGITSAGIDLSIFAVFGGALGLGIGFGLQKGVSNLFSGMLLLIDKSIKPGDVIELPAMNTFGWVEHMGARYTNIVTRDNKSFLIPNEEFITQQVVNWSHGNTLVRMETDFGVHYDSDPYIVKKLAEEAAKTPDRVVDVPAPVCHFVEFGDSSLNFVVRYWIKDAEKGVYNMRSAVLLALWSTFKEHGIKIPYPHREVIIRDVKEVLQ